MSERTTLALSNGFLLFTAGVAIGCLLMVKPPLPTRAPRSSAPRSRKRKREGG